MKKEEIYQQKNIDLSRRECHCSPSKKYRITIDSFKTGENTWDYTRCEINRVIEQEANNNSLLEKVGEVYRNYSRFPFLFIENHPNGSDYLICGSDYQGQTVIQLDTGTKKEFLPDEAKNGYGFCWAEYFFDRASCILAVCGCYWAHPYEWRFYDFSDPMEGWPEIQITDSRENIDEDDEITYVIEDEFRKPTFESDGIIKTYQSEYIDDNFEEYYDEKDNILKIPPLASVLTFKRTDDKLVLIDEWVSEKEKETRIKRKEAAEAWNKWRDEFQKTDPLYLAYKTRIQDPAFSPSKYESIGRTYENWCPDFKKEEKKFCRRVINGKSPYTVDLEWAVETGPIKLVVYKHGEHFEDKFFMEHSVKSMHKAFDYIENLKKPSLLERLLKRKVFRSRKY